VRIVAVVQRYVSLFCRRVVDASFGALLTSHLGSFNWRQATGGGRFLWFAADVPLGIVRRAAAGVWRSSRVRIVAVVQRYVSLFCRRSAGASDEALHTSHLGSFNGRQATGI
jgi:hypothetical protein